MRSPTIVIRFFNYNFGLGKARGAEGTAPQAPELGSDDRTQAAVRALRAGLVK